MPQQLNLLSHATGANPPPTTLKGVHFPRQTPRWGRKKRRAKNFILKAEKSAIIIKQGDVNTQAAAGHMSAGSVMVPCPCSDVKTAIAKTIPPPTSSLAGSPAAIKSPLKFAAWARGLADHPDCELVNYILSGILYGVDIGYTGLHKSSRIHNNWPSFNKHRDEAEKLILDDLSRGRCLGSFSAPPTSSFVGNPMGAYIKKRSSKIRLIHDLSWPPEHSINDSIDKDAFSLQYIKFDDITTTVKNLGPHCYMAKIDLESAFKHIMVKPEHWDLLGFTVKDKYTDKLSYYMCTCLPFGLRSSVKLFDRYAEAMEYIMYKNGVSKVFHYIDDYLTISSNYESCQSNFVTMLNVSAELGFSVQPKKVIRPSKCVEMLGIIIDSSSMELRISDERLCIIKEEITSWSHKKSCTKRQLLSLIGKLEFVSKVVRNGRSFLRRLIELSKKVKHLHHKIRINQSAMNDLRWWQNYMPHFHGVSILYDTHWSSSDTLKLWTDASDFGIGCVYKNLYLYEKFDNDLKNMPIAWRELYSILVCCSTWAHHFVGKRLLFNCDNEVVVHCLKYGVSKNCEIMTLYRKLLFIGACNNFECSAVYITSKNNLLADALSRGDIKKFLLHCKESDTMCSCKPVNVLNDLYLYR